MIPAERYPNDAEPVTEPFVLDLVALIPTQRCAPPDVVRAAPPRPPVRRPDPVLVQEMAAPPARQPFVARLTAVVVGTGLVAVLLLVVLLGFR
ncbi:hypothetical protein ACQEVB_37575 [Pseudonocardia sp. CA-107938]|uniref:hypothetical protein n=1 Tax=Pseudonocardia sp. CA-107938 TaxID=3240021 RepID=UPI003D90F5D1